MSYLVDDILQKLIGKGLSEEEIERQIQKKAQQYGNFMTKQGILFIIAKEYGIKLYSPEIDPEIYKEIEEGINYDEFTIPIEEIQEGMQNIVLLGKIINIFQIREFVRKDGTIGKLGSFIISDTSGTIKVLLWDDKIVLMNNEYFKKGEIIRIIGGYSKKGKNNSLEVHMGRKGIIQVSPNNITPHLREQFASISIAAEKDINSRENRTRKLQDLIEISGFIEQIQGFIQIEEFREVNKKGGDKTFLLKLIISDDSASIRLLIWGIPALDCLKIIKEGAGVHITNLRVQKNSYTNEKELIFTKKSSLKILE